MSDATPSTHLSRRSLVLQLAAAGATACAFPKNQSDPTKARWDAVPGSQMDTGSADSGLLTASDTADTAFSIDTATPADTAAPPADTALDTGSPAVDTGPDYCGVDETASKTCVQTSYAGEGPNYLANPPERSNLNVLGEEGTRLIVSGRVMSPDCVPFENARVDIWHAGQDAQYGWSKKSFHCRGYVLTAADGSYCFETLHPPVIPRHDDVDNAQHLHIKIWVDDEVVLITQVYFEGDPSLKKVMVVPSLIQTVNVIEDGLETLSLDFVVDPENPKIGHSH